MVNLSRDPMSQCVTDAASHNAFVSNPVSATNHFELFYRKTERLRKAEFAALFALEVTPETGLFEPEPAKYARRTIPLQTREATGVCL